MTSSSPTNTDKKLDAIDKRFDEVLSAMSQFADDTNIQFAEIKQEISALKTSHDRLLNTVDGFVGRIDKYETELAARDHEIARLKRWINEIADKTGVKLTT